MHHPSSPAESDSCEPLDLYDEDDFEPRQQADPPSGDDDPSPPDAFQVIRRNHASTGYPV